MLGEEKEPRLPTEKWNGFFVVVIAIGINPFKKVTVLSFYGYSINTWNIKK